jgi:hydrogenase/urease accessory protein HupE
MKRSRLSEEQVFYAVPKWKREVSLAASDGRQSMDPPEFHAGVAHPRQGDDLSLQCLTNGVQSNGMRAWISTTFISISSAGNPKAAVNALTSFPLHCR